MQKISLLLAVTLFAVSCGSSSSGNQIAFDRSSFDTRIAFADFDGIFVMDPDGTDRCSGGRGGGAFSWSPDGSQIAFTHWKKDDPYPGEIFVMYADCTGIYSTGQKGNSAEWSPDGNQIAFSSERAGDSEIFVMNADGTEVRQLTNNNLSRDETPEWSPDGNQIAFSSDRTAGNDNEIFVMNADGTDIYSTGKQGDHFSWSPDGSQIIFEDKNNMILVTDRADGIGGSLNLSKTAGLGLYDELFGWIHLDENPEWSPDGSQIAAWTCCERIVVMDADGTSAYDLIKLSWEDGLRPSAIASACDNCWEILNGFSWSPDGSQIAFVASFRNDSYYKIFVINADGTGLYSTGREGRNPKWSPDG